MIREAHVRLFASRCSHFQCPLILRTNCMWQSISQTKLDLAGRCLDRKCWEGERNDSLSFKSTCHIHNVYSSNSTLVPCKQMCRALKFVSTIFGIARNFLGKIFDRLKCFQPRCASANIFQLTIYCLPLAFTL